MLTVGQNMIKSCQCFIIDSWPCKLFLKLHGSSVRCGFLFWFGKFSYQCFGFKVRLKYVDKGNLLTSWKDTWKSTIPKTERIQTVVGDNFMTQVMLLVSSAATKWLTDSRRKYPVVVWSVRPWAVAGVQSLPQGHNLMIPSSPPVWENNVIGLSMFHTTLIDDETKPCSEKSYILSTFN